MKKETTGALLIISCLFLLSVWLYGGTKTFAVSQGTSPSKNHSLEDTTSKKEGGTEKNVQNGEMASGTWGTVPYTFDSNTGTLTLTGGGKLGGSASSPWNRGDSDKISPKAIKKIIFTQPVVAPENSGNLFGSSKPSTSLSNVNSIERLDFLDTSKVTSMWQMFTYASSLKTLDVSHFKTKNVTNMHDMFYGLSSLKTLDVSHFDTSNVIDMGFMFCIMRCLTNLDVSHFDTRNVKNMDSTFYGLRCLTNLDVSHFDTSNVIDMGSMFYAMHCLTNLDVSHFNTRNVTNMRAMFYTCTALTELNLSNFDTSNVKDMNQMFNSVPLKKLVLGQNFKFIQKTDLGTPSIALPYMGKWQNIGAGTVDSPKGQNVWTSDQFQTTYNGQTDADTYVWAKRPVTTPVITTPQMTRGTVPAEKNATMKGTGSPSNQLTLQTYVSATQTWVPVKNGTTTVADTGKWAMKGVDLTNKTQYRIVAQFSQDDTVIVKTESFTALSPSIPLLISPKQTNQTIPPHTETTFSGTGQADDQLRVEIRTNATAPWETKGQTQVDAQGKWEVKGITTQDNQEVRLVTQRPGGTQEAISPTWTVKSTDTFTGIANVTYDSGDTPIPGDNWELIIPTSYDFTGGNNPGPDGKPGLAVKGNVRLTDPYGNTYNGDKTVSVAVTSLNKGVLKNKGGAGNATYQLQDDEGVILKDDGSVPIASLTKGRDKQAVNAALTKGEKGKGNYGDILTFSAQEKS